MTYNDVIADDRSIKLLFYVYWKRFTFIKTKLNVLYAQGPKSIGTLLDTFYDYAYLLRELTEIFSNFISIVTRPTTVILSFQRIRYHAIVESRSTERTSKRLATIFGIFGTSY